ncbi:MAG: hypothetical protein JW760_10610 [Spirochaetales bacterium]|nr:hypothetical protein [Spirochaetales bacterium]
MKYSILQPESTLPPWEQKVDIYILPVSENPEHYLPLSPESLKKGREFTLLRQTIELRVYENCPAAVIQRVKETLALKFKERGNRFSSRMKMFFTTGVAAFILGLINMFVPDPLPYLDEAVLLLGGGLVALLSGLALNRRVEPFHRCIDGIREGIDDAEILIDPLLTTLYKAIRTKARPEECGSTGDSLDDIDRESAWLVTYLDLPALLQDGKMDETAFFHFIRVLSQSFGLRRFRLHRKGYISGKKMEKLGLDRHAREVYEALFVQAGEIAAQGGKKFP